MSYNKFRMSLDDELRLIRNGDWGMLGILVLECAIIVLPIAIIGGVIWLARP